MTISIVNHKGGTGKTTTTINLGCALANKGFRVLLVDCDAQGSLSYSLGISDYASSISEGLLGEVAIATLLIERENMQVISANQTLADVELAIAMSGERYHHLQSLLSQLPQFDFILIDCPPSLSLLTLNALVASNYLIIPMQMDVLALRGLDSMLETVRKSRAINGELEVLGILPVMVDNRKNICQEIRTHIKENYDEKLFDQVIHTNVKAAEAPSFGKSLLSYAPNSTTAKDYINFSNEVLNLLNKDKKLLGRQVSSIR